MARTQIRSKVGVVTTTLGLAVLLAGPTATLGLGVPTVDSATTQVTSTVQGAVQTTQQTAATTVTQVESTVQSTVQTTQQVATTQQTAPSPAPSAPTQAVTRASAPVKKAATRVSRPAAPAKQVASAVSKAKQQLSTAGGSVRTTATKRTAGARTQKVTTRTAGPRTQSRTTDKPSSQCDVPLLALLPGGNELGALLSLACEAAGGLDLPARLGLAPQTNALLVPSTTSPATSPSSAAPSSVRARAAAVGSHSTSGDAARAAANAASAAHPGALVAGIHTAGSGHAGALAYADGVNAAQATPASHTASRGADASRHHHTWFSGQSRGTEILLALIFASLSVLGGIILWRLAVRWVIPRFA